MPRELDAILDFSCNIDVMSFSHSAMVSPTFISLYSGAGGMDLGFAKAGFTPVFANDIDPNAVRTHNAIPKIRDPEWVDAAQLFEGVDAIAADVRDLDRELFEGMADILIGGPPCQGFSVAGNMDPNDPRSKHVFDFLGIVAKIKPRAFVMENVAALARNKRWRSILMQLTDLASLNYRPQLVVLNASHWRTPQARERMFLIGLPADVPDLDFSQPPTIDQPLTVREVLTKLPAYNTPGNDSLCTAKITPAKNPVLRKSPFAGMLFNGQGRVINLDGPSQTLPASMGGNRTPIIDQANLEDANSQPWIIDYHRRLFHDRKAPLKKLPSSARLRRLTVEEAAAIQTFPNDMKWSGPQSAQFRQIGNAVPPNLALAVAEELMRSLALRESLSPRLIHNKTTQSVTVADYQ